MRTKQFSESGAFNLRAILAFFLFSIGASLAVAALTIELVPGTAVLLSQSSTTSGNGGNTSSTSTMTNIFSPPTFVDYKRIGTEPVVAIDRWPYLTMADCAPKPAPCYKDIVYIDSTEGFGYPRYDFFWKSENIGQSFRLPHNDPTLGGRAMTQGEGGGDGHHAVGEVTHKVFFIDLPFDTVTLNTSADHGDTFTFDETVSNFEFADDRQWIDTDENFPGAPSMNPMDPAVPASPNVYINFTAVGTTFPATQTIVLTRSTHDGATGSFITDSTCNPATAAADNPSPGTTGPANDNVPTRCPDPQDPTYSVAGPVVVDRSTSGTGASHPHRLYIPFLRCTGDELTHGLSECTPPYHLYIARSDDGGTNWVRRPLCNEATHTGVCLDETQNPRNIFVQMTVDRGGNLYYTWAQKPIVLDETDTDIGGEADIYYAFSTNGGDAWSQAINLTKETGDSAVWPWMVAGDPGQVDLVYYKANNGEEPSTANPGTVWNVFFAQSQNALNTGPNFKSVQISDHPNHLGAICLSGLGCTAGRTLGDFFTMDVDHLGAANVVWADDNNEFNSTFIKFSRQLSGNSVFKNTTINLVSSWPIKDHTAFDPQTPDVITPTSFPGIAPSCASMDIRQMSASRSGDLLTVTLTLTAPPTAANAAMCAGMGLAVADGGFWGAEWWSSDKPNQQYYLAYIDEPGTPAHVEAGRVDAVSIPAAISNEPRYLEDGMPVGGTCFATPTPPSPCTLIMTASLSGLGVKSGAGLYSLTGLSLYITGNTTTLPFTTVSEGYTSLGDATPAIDYTGTGTTSK
jgi:hypothetical protein